MVTEQLLTYDSLPEFLEHLMQVGTVHGPLKTAQGVSAFSQITSISDADLGYHRTLIPPKKYLLPPRVVTLKFNANSCYSLQKPASTMTVLFGVHACDLAAIGYLDRVFLEDRPDPAYRARREQLFLVGLSCEADEFCFCGAVGLDTCIFPYDIFLTRTQTGFTMRHGSKLGEEVLAGFPARETLNTEPLQTAKADIAMRIERAVQTQETYPQSPLWDDFATRCLSCGACSLCCPTCYCVDVREYGSLDGNSADRIQEWDNCLFKSHGEVAGGTNFRKTRQDRFHYRFLHKYLGFGPLKGVVSCVGCGRCRAACPVDIDLLELFRKE